MPMTGYMPSESAAGSPGSILSQSMGQNFGLQQTNANNAAANYQAQLGLQGTLAGVGANMFGSQLGYQGQLAGYQNQLQQAQIAQQTALAGQKAQTQQAQIAANAQEYAPTLQNQQFQTKWNSLFPLINGLGNTLTSYKSGSGGTGANFQGQPAISANPVWSQQQIDQQVNSQNANVDAGVQTNVRNTNQSLAGRGFGAGSPLSQALDVGYQGQGLQQKMANQQNTNWNAAQGNAQQVLQGQQAQEQQFANRQNEAIQRQQVYTQQYNALLGALASM